MPGGDYYTALSSCPGWLERNRKLLDALDKNSTAEIDAMIRDEGVDPQYALIAFAGLSGSGERLSTVIRVLSSEYMVDRRARLAHLLAVHATANCDIELLTVLHTLTPFSVKTINHILDSAAGDSCHEVVQWCADLVDRAVDT